MKKLSTLLLIALFSLPMFAADWKDVPVVDVQCSSRVKSDPDSHTKQCALSCAKSGFGIYTADGKFLKFDAKGNQEVMNALKGTDKKDHLRVDVKGEESGDTIKVESLKLV